MTRLRAGALRRAEARNRHGFPLVGRSPSAGEGPTSRPTYDPAIVTSPRRRRWFESQSKRRGFKEALAVLLLSLALGFVVYLVLVAMAAG